VKETKAAGYSLTPLAKKLGIVEGSRVLAKEAPDEYLKLLEPVPAEVVFDKRLTHATDVVHLFVTQKVKLLDELVKLRDKIRSDATVWVSWPKKASKVSTDITEDTVREVALPLGFVDIKVCAVTEIWSGL
jgi:hypothetical protein